MKERLLLWAFLVFTVAFAQAVLADEFPYELRYEVELHPEDDQAEVALELGKGAQHIRWMRFHIDPDRHAGFEGDGKLERDGEYVTWTPPDEGGRLTFSTPVTHLRSDGRFDARMTESWAVFRGDDLVPPARVRQRKGAEADATLKLDLPRGWSFVAPYDEIDNELYRIEHADRSFDRPTGWMAAGDLGVRWERINGISVAVAGPVKQGIRRMDILAFLNWNLPFLAQVLPELPERLLVVSARNHMWRGGLSGPRSLYVHASRPLISENGTSTLMHELVHVAARIDDSGRNDWIVEGLAEYYSLEIMRRSGTITQDRFEEALDELEEWAEEADDLDLEQSSGATTARAVLVMRDLDQEIRKETDNDDSLDEVFRILVESGRKVSLERLRETVEEVMGKPADSLEAEELPGIEEDDD